MPFGCCLCGGPPPPPQLKLHVDADRDGAVDNGYQNLDQWTWGRRGKGAIILCNNDDDDGTRVIPALVGGEAATLEIPAAAGGLDHTNQAIDGNDVPDIAPLEIRRHPAGRNFPAGWTGRLSVAAGMQNRIRIFAARAVAAAEVIGPTAGRTHNIPNLAAAAAVIAMGMEAVTYPHVAFNGFIDLTLEVFDAGANLQATHVARVRVAPWMAMHHLNPVAQVFVLNDGVALGHNHFRAAVTAAVTNAGVPAPTMAVAATYRHDRWFRDVMKVGFATLPNAGAPATRHVPVALRTANDRHQSHNSLLDRYMWREMVGGQVGFVAPQHPFINGSSLDSFGNLECSPPVTVNGRDYKFGRIVYGHDPASGDRMAARVRQFFDAQKVQAPFFVNTGWLDVGHVDEVFTFCPMPRAAKKFKVIIVSPALAMQILDTAAANGNGAAPLCGPPQLTAHWAGRQGVYPHLTVNAVRGNAPFVAVQATVQGHVDAIEARLVAELGLAPADIIKIPVLFTQTNPGKHVAYLPNPVNMLVVTQPNGRANLCVPKPFGPVVGGQCLFEHDITTKLAADYDVGAVANKGRIYFIDDFFTYHDLMGEIHCGTNEVRQPATDRWWWQLDWVV